MHKIKHEAYLWNTYLKGLMRKLMNNARQKVFQGQKVGKYQRTTCPLCGEADTQAFYVSYEAEPQVMWLCLRCHKEHSLTRGSIYDQLKRHNVPVISWEEWLNGKRPDPAAKKKPKNPRRR